MHPRLPTPPSRLRSGPWIVLLVVAVLLARPSTVPGQSAPSPPDPAGPALSLAEAVETARRNNPGYLATLNDAAVSEWDVRSAWGGLLPSLEANSSVSWQGPGEQRFGSLTTEQLGFADQPAFYFSSYGLGLSYTVNGSTLTAPGRARADRDATRARIRSREADLIQAVTRAYLEVLRRQEERRLAGRRLERARADLRLAEARLDVGSATELDVGRAQVAVGRARVEVLRADNGVHSAHLALHRQIGVAPPDEEELPRLTTEFELAEPRWTEEGLFQDALRFNPELEALRASRRAADSHVTAARSSYFPSLSLQAGLGGFTREAADASFFVQQARSQAAQQIQSCQALNELVTRLADPLPPQDCSAFELTDDQVQAIIDRNDTFPFDFTGQPAQASLSISIPVFQGFSRQRELEAARAEREDARYRIREQELALRADIGSGLAAVRTAYESARIEVRNREVADEQLRLAREQYEVGRIAFIELVEAETVKAEADRAHLGALFDYHDAVANLEAVVGRSLREQP